MSIHPDILFGATNFTVGATTLIVPTNGTAMLLTIVKNLTNLSLYQLGCSNYHLSVLLL